MPRIGYKSMNLSDERLAIIARAVAIITDYAKSGLDLTLRQLYYQFVATDSFPQSWADPQTGSTNNERSYKKLGDVISDARMCGMIDWNSITDRTRNLRKRAEWDAPTDLIDVCADQFRIDRWANQPQRPEVWIEKDALVGVIENPCEENGVAYFSCRGYTSISEIWSAAQRLLRYIKAGQQPVIIHLGDHDPSGIDMSRDIFDRLNFFISHHSNGEAEVRRIALNMDQVRRYNPPPNPAKITDSRAASYISTFGRESWELDALDPRTINDLLLSQFTSLRNPSRWKDSAAEEEKGRAFFATLKDRFSEVEDFLA